MLPALRQMTVLKSVRWVVGHAMRRAGYRWELRRNGEMKIGLWRKSWSQKRSKSVAPRRLVLVPGFGDTSMSWLTVLSLSWPSIRRNYDEIVLFDFPGFAGFLSEEKAFHSMELLKTALFDALSSLSPKTVMGHSLGGWLATLYAVECGEGREPKAKTSASYYSGPENLILFDPSGVFVDESTSQELKEKFLKAIESETGYMELRKHVFAKEPAWMKWVTPHVSTFFKSQEIAKFIESFEEAHLITEKRLEKIASKVWLVWGEKDTLIPPTSIPLFLRALNRADSNGKAHCKAILIKKSGHSPQLETPAAVSLLLSQIMAETAGKPARFYNFPASERFWTLTSG